MLKASVTWLCYILTIHFIIPRNQKSDRGALELLMKDIVKHPDALVKAVCWYYYVYLITYERVYGKSITTTSLAI